jgi:hypothetical protein
MAAKPTIPIDGASCLQISLNYSSCLSLNPKLSLDSYCLSGLHDSPNSVYPSFSASFYCLSFVIAHGMNPTDFGFCRNGQTKLKTESSIDQVWLSF